MRYAECLPTSRFLREFVLLSAGVMTWNVFEFCKYLTKI